MHEQLVRRKATRQQAVADMIRDADEQRRFPLQGGEAALEHGRRDAPAVMRILCRVAAVERDYERNPQRPRDRQGERAAAAEMGVNENRPQYSQVRLPGSAPKCLNSTRSRQPRIRSTADQQRLAPKLGEPRVAMPPDPYRHELLETDIEPAQEVHFRTRYEAIPVNQDRAPIRVGPFRH